MKRKRVYSKKTKKKNSFDRPLIFLVLLLLLFGLIAIYDATVILSQDLYGSPYTFVLLQIAWILVGFAGFYVFYTLDIKTIRKISAPLFGVTLFFLLILALFGVLPCDTDFMFAPCINGANRWFYLNPPPLPSIPLVGVLGFQPSELAKFSLILYLSAMMEKIVKKKESPLTMFLIIAGVISFFIALEPNLSTAILLFTVGSVILFVSGTDLGPLLITYPALGLVGMLGLLSFSHTRERIKTFLTYQGGDTQLESGYHIKQILIALGSGGIFGLGFGQSRQKFQYLPEVFADSIFAIIGEELGFFGTALLVILFSALIYRGFSIAKKTTDLYSKLLAVGVTTWIALQFFVNVGAMTKIIPLTGIPLPLISYGGSSLIFMLMGLGVLANVSRKR